LLNNTNDKQTRFSKLNYQRTVRDRE